VTAPSGTGQRFTLDPSWGPPFTLADGESLDSSALVPGSYSVSEEATAGWDQTSATCDNGGSASTITLGSGQTVTCTFTNKKRGSIVLSKVTAPSPDASGATIQFTEGGGLSGGFGLKNGQSQTIADVAAGSGYSVVETALSGWDQTGATSSHGTPANIVVSPGETVTCSFTNTRRGTVSVTKTVNGLPLSGTQAFDFQLRLGASISAEGTILASGTASSLNGGSFTFSGAYQPAGYQLCELVMPGWRTSLSGTFVPNSLNNPLVDNSTICINFTLAAGEQKLFTINNTPPPGGLARTIGFWKNWSSCSSSKGNQKPVLDQTLAAARGVLIGGLSVTDCKTAVSILNKSDVKTGAKMASDPAYGLAAQLLAAKLNVVAGAGACTAASSAVSNGQSLLGAVGFTGTGSYAAKMSSTQGNQATTLAATLDRYNNNLFC
jgi:hypothetical protein